MNEKFVERGTEYLLECGKLMVYETNCICRDVKFYFEQNVMTLMLSGHKTIITDNLNFEFFPGTFYIPERETIHTVHIPNATFDNPTKCLVLELKPSFLNSYYEQLKLSEKDAPLLKAEPDNIDFPHFFSNNRYVIDTFSRLYYHRLKDTTRANEMIATLLIKELLLRVFQTDGLFLLKQNFEQKIADESIQRSVHYINNHLAHKITVEQLAKISKLGTTTFFKRFKNSIGLSPVEYILNERIKQSKILMLKNQLGLKEIAYRCGFNSYEYFCNSFKKIENMRPKDYRRNNASAMVNI
ncbi:MAG: helix-turn-helix domain-containing protein [Bacteroidota bacterium]